MTDPEVEAELDRLPTMPIVQLRIRYRELFRAESPKAFGPDLLRRSVAQRIQEKAYGGLPRETKRLLDQLIKAAIARPERRLELPRRIKPGSELVRTWKKKSHRVVVMADGFAYEGKAFTSLSEIACAITGTKWNGPRFFGLRSKIEPGDESAAAGPYHGVRQKAGSRPARSNHLGGGSDYRKRNAAMASNPDPKDNRHGR